MMKYKGKCTEPLPEATCGDGNGRIYENIAIDISQLGKGEIGELNHGCLGHDIVPHPDGTVRIRVLESEMREVDGKLIKVITKMEYV